MKKKRTARTNVRLVSVGIVVALIAIAILTVRINTEARKAHRTNNGNSRVAAKPTPEVTPVSSLPPQTQATRIRIIFGESHELRVATGVDSLVVVSPEIAQVNIKDRFTLTISPLKRGETMLVVTYGQRRRTYIIQVVPPLPSAARRNEPASVNIARAATSGSFTTMFAPQLGGGSSVLRQTIDLRKKLSNDRTLRVSGEMFKLFGNTERSLAAAPLQDLALNRVSVGIDTPTRSIDILDSQVNVSALSLNNYAIRGFHLSSKRRADPKDNLPSKGLEVFAGLARPSLAFFGTNGGKLAGIMVPVIRGNNLQARAGAIAISPDKKSREAGVGLVFQADAAYAPTKEIVAEAEMSYARGALSWRARLDLKFGKYGASGEVTRFARSSPLNSIGAQYGGRESEAISFYWRPVRGVGTSVGYSHSTVTRLTDSRLADLDRSLLSANASYAVTKTVRLTMRYTDQKIETAFPGSPSKFAIQTRTLSIGNTYKVNSNWSNTIEGRINLNRETNADAGLETGFGLNEQLRFAWQGGSVTGFLRYNRRSASFISLIVRNPGLLPPPLQAAFALDPAEFLRLNRDRLSFLLPGVELPETRSVDAGVQFQKTFSRLTISGETRYNADAIYAVQQKRLLATISVGVRLNRANSLRANLWRAFGGGRSGMTVSFTHQFGSSGDGFRLASLFGFNGRKVRGRVFNDFNSNGLRDPGEPGLAGMKLQIDGDRLVTTDREGRYEFSTSGGDRRIALVASELGVRLFASTPTEVSIGGDQKLDVNFGVRDHGEVSGRVFNDIGPTGHDAKQNGPGLGGVKVTLRSTDGGLADLVLTQVTRPDGTYDFSNIMPGKYLIEIDPTSVPPNFRIPAITGTSLVVGPLGRPVHNIPIAAQRAMTGVVYIDSNGDAVYTPGTDEAAGGAVVTVGDKQAIADAQGTFFIRNLPEGISIVRVASADGRFAGSFTTTFGVIPETKRGLDLRLYRR